jgi:hypothetical protein
MAHDGESSRQRPFYFVLVVWGEQYRNYFLEYCLPSLLAPGNLPALSGRRPAKYLIATTADDWAAMRDTAIFRALERHAVALFLELPPQPPDRPYWMQAILGHKLCCDVAFRDQAYRIFTGPDAVYSDGMVARLHDLALGGADAVVKLVTPSVDKESFFATLAQTGMLPSASLRDTGDPLTCSGRQLAAAALRSMHRMTLVNEWQSPFFCGYAATPWWRVPGEEGIVVCGLFWDLLLLDYAAVRQHDSAILDDRGFDGDYIMRTAGDLESFYPVRDSDEIHVVSWVSYPETPPHRQTFGELGRGAEFRASAYGPMYNALHRQFLFLPARVHAGPLNDKWNAVDEQALATLLTWLDPPHDLARLGRKVPSAHAIYADIEARIAAIRLPWWRRNAATWAVCRDVLMPLAARVMNWRPSLGVSRILIHLIGLALRGDPIALRWWHWRARKLAAAALGRPFREPRPQVPK